ncbi:hypothetical protein B0H14DRAFT_2785172 [Mycena olivaceomarginata]|nr:hypothetical protein B0H14DRAFT_2785172 [Mycena olivaceomarginata]
MMRILLLACSRLLWRDLLRWMCIAAERNACSDLGIFTRDAMTCWGQWAIGKLQDLCLKGHHRQNRLYRLMKGWQVLARMCTSNTERIWSSWQN